MHDSGKGGYTYIFVSTAMCMFLGCSWVLLRVPVHTLRSVQSTSVTVLHDVVIRVPKHRIYHYDTL